MFIKQNYRIYPNQKQKEILNQWLGGVRFIWNYMLNLNINSYKENKKFIFAYDMNNMLPSIKKNKEFCWLKDIPAQGLQQKCQDLDTALKASFKNTNNRKGFPKFKSKKTDESGIRFSCFKIKGNKIYLPKIKQGIKIKIDRELLGKAGLITVKKDKVGNYFVSISVNIGNKYDEIISTNEVKSTVGIDVGIKSFAILSNGEKITNPLFKKKQSKKLKRLQRKLCRKQKDSNNREKSRIKLAKLNRRIRNQRKDYIKQNASSIAKRFDLVCVEDLNVRNMQQNHIVAKNLIDVPFSMFIDELNWQCKKRGKILYKIDRYFPSSKTCSQCGNIKSNLILSNRIYKCDCCGFKLDRDLNAAVNIANEGMKKLNINIPLERRKFTPVSYDSMLMDSEQEVTNL